ncbi:hypothetical protein [Shewanella algidipiscicola]|uniref:hypothetical protein n=1 Tax=Shewanella algidipiscicola TaxID=614070 RepID=UPI000D78434F|nr:hypothetical protein [Shewanella algidipiscicola]
MVFTILTLFCLTQNSGMLNLLLKEMSVQASSATAMTSVNPVASHTLGNIDGSSSAVASGSAQVKPCELSEKSMRVGIDTSTALPLFILLFLIPLIPLTSRVFTRLPLLQVYHAKPRRIHLTLCRFQE